jgi:WD40 repeat protein
MGVFIVTGQIKDRLLLQVGGLDFKTTDLRLIDYNGKIIDRRSGADLGRDLSRAKWVKKKGMLLVAVRRVSPSREFDLLGLRVNSSTIQPQVDTVLHRVELGGSGEFDISDDGGRMVFVSGPTEETVLAMNRNAQSGQFSKLRQVLASTAPVSGRISPNGDRIAIIRRVLSTQGKPSQILVTGFDSPTESTLGSPVEGLLDITWRPDGDNLVYSSQSGRASVRLTEVAVPGGQTRELGNVDGARGWNFAALRDSGFALIGADDRSVVLTARPGKKDIVFHGPAWITQILSLTPSPDGGFLAASALSRDTLAIAKINLRTGAFTRVGGMPFVGGAVSAITWLADGTIMQPVANDGGLAVYRVPSAGGPVRKQTSLQNVADIASSVDGSRAVAFTTRVRTDIYMIRNFGAFLER